MKRLFSIALLVVFSVILCKCINDALNPSQVVELPNTQMTIVNNTDDSVLVYLTLSGYSDSLAHKYVQNVDSIFGCTQTGLNGSFYLAALDSVSYTSTKRFSGNVSFGSAPLNCPVLSWPTGVNPFEFNLNVPQESIDISAVGGVNCLLSVDLIDGPNWVAAQYTNVRSFHNDSMYKNTNLVGVFPYGCTNCVNDQGAEGCVTKPETPDSTHICNPTRSAGVRGGIVVLKFNGFTN